MERYGCWLAVLLGVLTATVQAGDDESVPTPSPCVRGSLTATTGGDGWRPLTTERTEVSNEGLQLRVYEGTASNFALGLASSRYSAFPDRCLLELSAGVQYYQRLPDTGWGEAQATGSFSVPRGGTLFVTATVSNALLNGEHNGQTGLQASLSVSGLGSYSLAEFDGGEFGSQARQSRRQIAVGPGTYSVNARVRNVDRPPVVGDQRDALSVSVLLIMDPPPPTGQGGSLRDVNRFGEPAGSVAEAQLSLVVGEEVFATATSAADGRFVFEGLQAPDDLYDLRIQRGDIVRVYQSIRPTQLAELTLALPVDLRARLGAEFDRLENTPPLFLAYDTSRLRALLAAWNGSQPQDATVHALRDRALSRLLIASEGLARLFSAVEPLAQDAGKQTVDTITSVLSMRQAVREVGDLLDDVVDAAAPALGESLARVVLQAVVKSLDLLANALQSALTDGVKATLPPFATELFEDAFGVVAKGVLGTFSSAQWNLKDGRRALLEGVVESLLQEVGGRVLGTAYVAQTQQDLALAEVRARAQNFAGTQVDAFTASTTALNTAEVRIDDVLAVTALLGETGKGWSTVADVSVLIGRAPGAQLAAALGTVVKSMSVAQLAGATVLDFLAISNAALDDAPAVAELALFPTVGKAQAWHPPVARGRLQGKRIPEDYTAALAALRAAVQAADAVAIELAAGALLAAEDALQAAIARRQQRLLALAAAGASGLDHAARREALARHAVFDAERALLYMQIAGHFVPALASPGATPADLLAQLDVVDAAAAATVTALQVADASVQGVAAPAFLLVERHGLGEAFAQGARGAGPLALHVRLRNAGETDIPAASVQLLVGPTDAALLSLSVGEPALRMLGPLPAGAAVDLVWTVVPTWAEGASAPAPVDYRLVPSSAAGLALNASGAFVFTPPPPDRVFANGFEAAPTPSR